jgi:hypothetical protein
MIKIEDNIINENKIIQISINEDNNLEIDIEHSFPIVIKNATFDDIQWEYDRFKVEADKDGVVFANRILEKKIKQLEEENKDLYRQIDSIMKLNSDAAKYILDNCIDEKTGRISNPDILKIFKFLSNGGEPIINKGSEE